MSEQKLLRRKAEELLANLAQHEMMHDKKGKELLHELRVYQIELELQNEELMKTRDSLETIRTRYLQLYNNAPIGYLVLNYSGIIHQANNTFLKMTGYSGSKITGQTFTNFIISSDIQLFRSRYRSFFTSPQNKSIEIRLKRNEKDAFYARIEAVPHNTFTGETEEKLPDEDAELWVTISDISSEKEAMSKTIASENLLRTIFETQGEGVILVDLNFNILLSNPKANTIFENTQNGLTGKSLESFIPMEQKQRFSSFPKQFETEDIYLTEFELFRPYNENLPVLFTITPHRDHLNNIIGYLLVVRDFSKQKKIFELVKSSETVSIHNEDEKCITICASCNNIKSTNGNIASWISPPEYFKTNQYKLKFSHGICPTCLMYHYPDYYEDMNKGSD